MPANAYPKAPVFSTVVLIINIKGSYVGNRQDSIEAIDFFAKGLIHAPYKVVPLKELPHVYDLMGTLFPILKMIHFASTYQLRSS
jgi:alcohol dehydrogenase, propanol-preferring